MVALIVKRVYARYHYSVCGHAQAKVGLSGSHICQDIVIVNVDIDIHLVQA